MAKRKGPQPVAGTACENCGGELPPRDLRQAARRLLLPRVLRIRARTHRVGWKEVEEGGVMGTLEVAEQAFTSSVADLEDATISFLAVATPEEGQSAREHLGAIRAAVHEVLAMAIRLDHRATELRGFEHYRAA